MAIITPGKYKNISGEEFQVFYLARNIRTLEELVVCQSLHGSCEKWIIPRSVFLEETEINGEIVQKFQLIEAEEKTMPEIKLNVS
jgi:hypothetical protein